TEVGLLMFAAVGLFTAVVQADVTLVKDGKPVARVFIAGDMELPELTAAELRKLTPEQTAQRSDVATRKNAIDDLLYHIKAMSGAELEVVVADDASKVTGPAIVFGELAMKLGATAKEDTLTDDAFRLIV